MNEQQINHSSHFSSTTVGEKRVCTTILVFKTNLTNTKHIRKVKSPLNLHPYIKDWNVDLHDCDNILRVVAENIPAREVEQIIVNAGYYCEELH
ncbi:MAG: copper chaperone [Parafilimonas sp.]